MSEQIRVETNNNVVQLNPDRTLGVSAQIALARLPAAMHSLRDKARQQLQRFLRDLFDKVDDAMFELADKASNNHEQNIYFDSMREVRLRRRAMETAFFRSIDIRFAQLLDHNACREETADMSAEFSMDDLSLVKNDDLEAIVAVDGMVNKANELFAEQIQHLTLRIDHLVPLKVYQKNNPVGADVICHAFSDAAKVLQIDVKAKLVLFKLFDHLVMNKLGGMFQLLNQLLIDGKILPSLKQGVRPKSRAGIPSQYAARYVDKSSDEYREASLKPEHGDVGLSLGGQYDEQTQHVIYALHDLLSARGPSPSQNRHLGGEISTSELVNLLSYAQQQHVFRSGELSHQTPQVNVRDLLQNLLRSHQQQTHQQQAHAINQVDDDVINLVSMMFEFILDDRNLAAPMKALIGRLQIPMVKVAIADKTFFSKGGHPARRLLNEMAMAALGWQESNDELHRKDGLFGKIEGAVQRILSDFETDMGIFNELLTEFRSFVEKDKRRAQILEQRTIDAEDGKAKAERARAQVDAVLKRLMVGHELPLVAQKLLRDAWGNVLFIICLKKGGRSDDWRNAIRTAQQLVWSLTAPMSKDNRQALVKLVPTLLQTLREGLDGISYNPFETAQLFAQLEVLHMARLRTTTEAAVAASVSTSVSVGAKREVSATVELLEEIVHDPVRKSDVVAVEDEVKTPILSVALDSSVDLACDAVPPEAAVPPAAVTPLVPVDTSLEALDALAENVDEPLPEVQLTDDLPDGDPHLNLVGNITQGSWFEMQTDDGQKFRCRLAAIIRAAGKYIFVNRSGVKVAEETRMSLALALKAGRLQLLDDGMLFDRALEAVIGNLRAPR